MYLREITIEGFKSFGKAATLSFPTRTTCIVGPNGSGKSNVTEAFRFVLGEQSMKSMRGRRGEDLIFNGGEGATRAQRASVSIVFDNSSRVLNDTFDTVTVSRTVYRDGTNEYGINGTQVRHRDVIEMLARANIGTTGHHIISQGEADRMLNSSPEERKEILEDGLGLKLLQYRRTEAEKKLNRAQKNIAETDLILREILPHMRHLKRQVDRYEKSRVIRKDLEDMYAEYFVRELHYLTRQKKELEEQRGILRKRVDDLEKAVSQEKKRTSSAVADDLNMRMRDLQEHIQEIRNKKDTAVRELGRLEGERNALTAFTETAAEAAIERKKISDVYEDIQKRADVAEQSDYPAVIAYIIRQIGALLETGGISDDSATAKRREKLEKECVAAKGRIELLEKDEKDYLQRQNAVRSEQEETISNLKQSEQTLVARMTEKNTAEQEMADINRGISALHEDEKEVQLELREGAVLIGSAVNRYKEISVPNDAAAEERQQQKKRKRLLERKKIELETVGTGSGEEVYREYGEVSERMTFLNREKEDLANSIRDCEKCIDRIQKEIDVRFQKGVKKISGEFESFFRILFGGGRASISIQKRNIQHEDGEPEERVGVAVQVSLPRKKIHSLEQLSGGERALVSIALLFAISQVTPPPFLVLDETDAALDEANSRRYSDIIETLAKRSQLILVTHNRETMHCAGALYGVTMNSGGVSTLLSIHFEEAVQAAK